MAAQAITHRIEWELARLGSTQSAAAQYRRYRMTKNSSFIIQDRLQEKLGTKTLTELLDIGRRCGVQLPSPSSVSRMKTSNGDAANRKQLTVASLRERMMFSLSLLAPDIDTIAHDTSANPSSESRWRPVCCLDLGLKNMAFATMDLEMRLLRLQRVSLMQSSQPRGREAAGDENLSTTDELLTLAAGAANLPAEFAALMHSFTENHLRSDSHTGGPEPLYIIEQQMQRHNPRCAIIEAQMHALLYPHTLSISPLTVSNFFSLKGEDSDTGKPVRTKAQSYQAKKKATVQLVDYWIANGIVLDPLSPALGRSDCQFILPVGKRQKQPKRDDLADCILSCVASVIWLRRLQHEAFGLLDF